MNIKAYKKRISGMKLESQIATIRNNINQKITRKLCLQTEYDQTTDDIAALEKMLEEKMTEEVNTIAEEVE